MTRTISDSLAPVLQQLELDAADLVTTSRLETLVREARIATPTRVVAARLRERGWLLETGQRGVWEFAPASSAGPYSRGGPTRALRSLLAKTPVVCGLTFQAAAWALGAADRAPLHPEVAITDSRDRKRMPKTLDVSVFTPVLPYQNERQVPVLRSASVLVHLATSPNQVRSWVGVSEWMPDLASDVAPDDVLAELRHRPATVSARCGYLLQGLRPDIAAMITGPATKTWFGPRGPLKRHDNRWKIADTLLPFDPRRLDSVLA